MSIHHVLGLLHGDEARRWAICAEAAALADGENARLTLAMTCDHQRQCMWMGASMLGAMCAPVEPDPEQAVAHALAQIVEFVPEWIPVTTQLLTKSPRRALRELVCCDRFDAFVVAEELLRHHRALRRALVRYPALLHTVGRHPVADPAAPPLRPDVASITAARARSSAG